MSTHPTAQPWGPQCLRVLLLMAGVSFASGCTSFITTQVACAPNHGRTVDISRSRDAKHAREMGADAFMRVRVGPPSASIGLWIFDPETLPRGTILVLHGVADGPFWMRDKARALARHGYRAVLIGLRGYAESSGEYRGFGVLERRDLAQVVDALERQHLLVGSLGVWGMSYGGATAIQYAGADSRVRAVVTVGAFSDMRSAVPQAVRLFVPIAGWLTSDEEYRQIIDEAAAYGEFDPDEASAALLIQRTDAPVLLVHGEWDWIVPFEHAERLHAAAPDHTTLMALSATGHVGSYIDFGGRVERAANEWFDRHLPPVPE